MIGRRCGQRVVNVDTSQVLRMSVRSCNCLLSNDSSAHPPSTRKFKKLQLLTESSHDASPYCLSCTKCQQRLLQLKALMQLLHSLQLRIAPHWSRGRRHQLVVRFRCGPLLMINLIETKIIDTNWEPHPFCFEVL